MKVAVVGPNSELGKLLVRELEVKKHDVFTWSRTSSRESNHYFNIDEGFSGSTEGLQAIFILAWKQEPRNRATFEANISAIGSLIEDAHKHKVKVIFISTLGAGTSSESFHVLGKQTIEHLLLPFDSIIRPASITNDSGSLAGNVKWIEKFALPIQFSFNPDLYIAKVNINKVVSVCISELSSEKLDSSLTLIDELTTLSIGNSKTTYLRFSINQEIASFIFKQLNSLPIRVLKDISDKWNALLSAQKVIHAYRGRD